MVWHITLHMYFKSFPFSLLGYRADNPIDDIIEHQADKIRSLQEQNSVLNRKLYSLTYKSSANAAQR